LKTSTQRVAVFGKVKGVLIVEKGHRFSAGGYDLKTVIRTIFPDRIIQPTRGDFLFFGRGFGRGIEDLTRT
jgi:hypothetical protein